MVSGLSSSSQSPPSSVRTGAWRISTSGRMAPGGWISNAGAGLRVQRADFADHVREVFGIHVAQLA